ncbi:MAG: hypothetical protein NWF10_08480 [Candidatus Bathyarchaeota archaeon]|nr:hypothetical protein [Candidatus Bathyarchaeota archaeon]
MSKTTDTDDIADLKKEIKGAKKRINYTFYSILAINWILIVMGIIAFFLAIFEAAGGEFVTAGVLSALGAGDIISVFKFSMNRVQRSLGDQTQVEAAFDGLIEQRSFINKVKNTDDIDKIRFINREIRTATLNTMNLIQDFTQIAEPLIRKPWIRSLPIKFGQLFINKQFSTTNSPVVVTLNKKITMTGKIKNTGKEPVTLNTIVLAVRPPGGTPDGGPWRYDFKVEDNARILKPNESYEIKDTKRLDDPEKIPDELLGKDWYAFIACETEDGCWHDDHSKVWFEVKRKP